MDTEGNVDQAETEEAQPRGISAIGAGCAGVKADGSKCLAALMPGSEYCYYHDPEYANERHLNAVKGNRIAGRGRPSQSEEYKHIKQRIADLTERTLAGDLDTKIAFAVTGLLNAYLRAMEQERQANEMVEIQAQIDMIVDTMEAQGKKWVTPY